MMMFGILKEKRLDGYPMTGRIVLQCGNLCQELFQACSEYPSYL
jgi:hypothetical protein